MPENPAVVTPLRKLRRARGLSLDEVAREVGSDTGNLSRIELGRQPPKPQLAAALTAFYAPHAPEFTELHIFYPERYPNFSPCSGLNS